MKRVGLIGFGAVGSEVANDLLGPPAGAYELCVLLRPGSAALSSVPDEVRWHTDLRAFLATRPDLIVEVAGEAAVRLYGADCLAAGRPLLVTSVGALADDHLLERLAEAAQRSGASLLLPSGAIGALDYVSAAARVPGTSVAYESRKPPAAWADELTARGIDPLALRESITLFSGSAREAARLYPKNLNVAATLALAGIGMDRTTVTVIVDPRASGNTHGVRTDGPAGRMTLEVVNRPSATNAKTSWIVAKSVVAAVKRFFASVRLS